MITLPSPDMEGGLSLRRAIFTRYSLRKFADINLHLQDVSNLLWSAGGKSQYRRTIPSAGATYPLEIYLITGEDGVESLHAGIYLYLWKEHGLEIKLKGDFRNEVAEACLGQSFIAFAPVSILITADYGRTTRYYGRRGIRYVHMEAGHCCQNIHLQAVSLGLGTVVVGAFDDRALKSLFQLEEEPLAVMPVGYPK